MRVVSGSHDFRGFFSLNGVGLDLELRRKRKMGVGIRIAKNQVCMKL